MVKKYLLLFFLFSSISIVASNGKNGQRKRRNNINQYIKNQLKKGMGAE